MGENKPGYMLSQFLVKYTHKVVNRNIVFIHLEGKIGTQEPRGGGGGGRGGRGGGGGGREGQRELLNEDQT